MEAAGVDDQVALAAVDSPCPRRSRVAFETVDGLDELRQARLDGLHQQLVRSDSQRYAEDDSEHTVVLERYNTVLDELFAGADVYVITPLWTTEAEVPSSQAVTEYWRSLLVEDDPDPEFRTYCHLFAARRPWRRGCIDELLRDIADDKVAGVLITDTRMQRIHHPYDGGADVFLATPDERDRMRDRHADWLSRHPSGL
ncbi:hypothetical protein [Streptomyces sp. SAI-127]|uniref:DUF3885 domain-containing protein n=1 Tax=Streptomyces sp. SAI-127 TaxID=2940543 RepID=UPI002472F5D0|nr:hypothetical protein [Streptomyces sp. SAI-127]MDH6484328.1 hypothetical protein [Streptomyces sp. SAI-127]